MPNGLCFKAALDFVYRGSLCWLSVLVGEGSSKPPAHLPLAYHRFFHEKEGCFLPSFVASAFPR